MLSRHNSSRHQRTFVPFLAAIALAPWALAQSAGQPEGVATNVAGIGDSSSQIIEQANQWSDQGKLIQAQALLKKALKAEGLDASARMEFLDLLARVENRIGRADRLDISVQKADLALSEGDLRTARRQAKAVAGRHDASAAIKLQAEQILMQSNARTLELEAQVPGMLAQAEADFKAQRYAQAKAAFEAAYRSDVALTPEQQLSYDRHTLKIMEVERQQGTSFDAGADAMLAVMQPGQVRRPGQPETPPQPAPEPMVEPPAPAPEAVAQPQPQPVAPPPEPSPNAAEIVRQSMQLDAQRILAEAEASMNAGSFNDASRKFQRLRDEFREYLSPDQLARVNAGIASAETRLGNTGQPDQLGSEIDNRTLEKQRIVAEYNNLLEQANRSLATGDIEAARGQIAQAKLRINEGRSYFGESEYQGLLDRANQSEAAAAKASQDLAARTAEARERELQDQSQRQGAMREGEREQRINELLDRARAFQAELRYEDALQAVDQLLFIDPNNPAGLLLRDAYEDIVIYRAYQGIQREKNVKHARLTLDAEESMIPPVGMVNYPREWPTLSFQRGEQAEFVESPEDRRVLAELDSKRIPRVDFPDGVSLADVVDFMRTASGANIDPDWSALDSVGVNRDTQVSLTLSNVSIRSLLDRVVSRVNSTSTSRIDWTVQDGVVVIASDEAIRKKTELIIYDVRDLLIDVPDYDRVPEIDLQTALQSGQGGGQSPFRNDQQNADELRQRRREERTRKLEELVSIIEENIDEDWENRGGQTGKIKSNEAGTLIITNTPKAHRQVVDLLSKLRAVRSMQVNVETRFLLVNQDYFEQIGFDLDVYFNANNNQVRVARGADRSIQASDFFENGRLKRVITGQVAPNAAVTAPNGTQLSQAVVNPRNMSTVGVTQDSLGLAGNIAPASDWAQGILDGAPALGVAGQFLDDIQVDFLVQATQADRRSVQLTAPRVTFTNGQTSNIYVATQRAFVSDLTPIPADSAVGFDPETDVVTEGVTLLVTGTVTADRRYVTMNIDTGVARIDGFAQESVSAVAGGQLAQSATVSSFIQLPTVTVTRVRTTVTVPDQGTLLLGGQRLITEFEVETGVPVLSKIPVINRFFTNRIESKEEQTLLILVKPTILIQSEQEEKSFPGLQDRLRSGFGG